MAIKHHIKKIWNILLSDNSETETHHTPVWTSLQLSIYTHFN